LGYSLGMNELTTNHYQALLGLDSDWKVSSVDFQPSKLKVDIRIDYCGKALACPKCQAACSQADLATERTWRHLDTMQFITEIHARVPRSKCTQCGVLTLPVPWADKHARFTLLFEQVAIAVIQACSTVSAAATLLGLDWDATQGIMTRAVKRGLARRELDGIEHVGIDEKSFGKGHDYVSIMTDIDKSRVLEVVPERTREAADKLWETIPKPQRDELKAVAMDMWPAFMSSTKAACPNAKIVHDKFHVSKYLGEAVDKVRRQENKRLEEQGDQRLKGTRQLWLYRREKLSEEERSRLYALQHADLKTGRAWSLKENFRHFWECEDLETASLTFTGWYGWATRCQLKPIIQVAKMLKRHLEGLMSYITHRITNAISEGFNSRIQSLKSAARGFRKFENYRTRILFFCGDLDLSLDSLSH
jgi:transposase